MNITLFEDAIALIEEGSMRSAAHRRNVTQPAFSRRIKTLEAWLGVELVERHANRIKVKRSLLDREPEIRAILARISAFKIDYVQPKNLLTIGTQHSLATSVFPEIYKRIFELQFVDEIKLRTRNQDEITSQFLKFEIDLSITYRAETTPRLPFDESVIQKIWRQDALVPLVGGNLLSTLNAEQEPPADAPIIRYPDTSEFGKILNANFEYVALSTDRHSVVETAFAAGVIATVKLGAGIGWVPRSLAREEIRRRELLMLAQKYGHIPINVVLTAHQDNQLGGKVMLNLIPETPTL